uniref:Envelope glycoprotein n=1 Tax=Anolis carolinensis TaxID=28377 RepID=A0A803U1S8_ANOCA
MKLIPSGATERRWSSMSQHGPTKALSGRWWLDILRGKSGRQVMRRGGKRTVFGILFVLSFILSFGKRAHGNWIKEHANYMFEQHGKEVALIYEHPLTIGDFSFLPDLIDEPQIVLEGLSKAQEGPPTVFSSIPKKINKTRFRRFRYHTSTRGLCFCCGGSGIWNSEWKHWGTRQAFFSRLGNYSHCRDRFYLHGRFNTSYVSRLNLTATEWASMYPDYPTFSVNDSIEGLKSYMNILQQLTQLSLGKSLCPLWQIRDPNLWFFFDKWATNYHPGNYQCVGVGYLTFPVQVLHKRHQRLKRDIVQTGPLGPECSDEVIINKALSGSEASRVGGGLITGLLTLGAYPGIVAQANRRSVLGLTCRLEKSINATGKIFREIQSEVEEISQMALQHKLALDYLLAARGGLCAMVRGRCVVKFHNLNSTIEDDIESLQKLIYNNVQEKEGWSPFSWVTSWLPSIEWLKNILLVGILGLFIVLIVMCCTPIMMQMCTRCVTQSLPEKKIAILQAKRDWMEP